MSVSFKTEGTLLKEDELRLVRSTHHPFIHALDRGELQHARERLRDWRDKERTLSHHKRREARGKGEPRGASFPGTYDHPKRRQQVFASAQKRTNKELERVRIAEARAALANAAHRALTLRRSALETHHPDGEAPAGKGMRPLPSRRRRMVLPPGKIGSVSQRVRNAQAKRDAR